MPEGPEVRKYADVLHSVLAGRRILSVEARTREAKQWLAENDTRLVGRRVLRVVSHGKHLIGYIHGRFYFHSHLMMWGRWQTFPAGAELPDRDRRERARVVAQDGAAILLSAPIFDVGKGDPYEQIENLATLGPDVLPYERKFDRGEFLRRLLSTEYSEVSIGAALLNQQILAGLGNYLRAEVLFHCQINPWRKVSELSKQELNCLSHAAPELALGAYRVGATATEPDRERMRSDTSLVYQPGREYGTRHLVFRRTNLPCLRCGGPIKQLRQPTYNGGSNSDGSDGEQERTRIVYYCPKCQGVK
jgi:endonuclease-8